MEPSYYLYGPHGWLTRTGQASTDFLRAASYPRNEALALTERRISDGQFGIVPVCADDVDSLL